MIYRCLETSCVKWQLGLAILSLMCNLPNLSNVSGLCSARLLLMLLIKKHRPVPVLRSIFILLIPENVWSWTCELLKHHRFFLLLLAKKGFFVFLGLVESEQQKQGKQFINQHQPEYIKLILVHGFGM